jgi:hypothetical protein
MLLRLTAAEQGVTPDAGGVARLQSQLQLDFHTIFS